MPPHRCEFFAPAAASLPLLLVAMALPAAISPAIRSARPNSSSEWLSQGENALEARDWASAERAFRRAVALAPRSARAHSGLAIALDHSEKSSNEAIAEARRATELAPGEIPYLVRYGATLAHADRWIEARTIFRRARAMRPSDLAILRLLAETSIRLQDDEAIPLLRQIIEQAPEDRSARLGLADFLWGHDDPAGGDAVMEDALRTFPRDAEMHAAYARSLLQRLQFSRAIDEFSHARELGRNSAPLLNALGEAYWEAGRSEDARKTLEAAIEAGPRFFPSHLLLGRLLLQTGRPSEAAKAFTEAVHLQPDSAPAQWNLGRALVATGDLEGAEKAFRVAVEQQPRVSRYRYSLAILLRQRRDAAADAEFSLFRSSYDAEQRAEYEASSRRVELNGAVDLLRQGKLDESLKRFRDLPESVQSLEGQADVLRRQGRHREAIGALERASALAPDDVTIQTALAREYAEASESR